MNVRVQPDDQDYRGEFGVGWREVLEGVEVSFHLDVVKFLFIGSEREGSCYGLVLDEVFFSESLAFFP
jgi:hypothetical protein